ncbi:MAG: site-2 protease family protein [Phycisphaerales bacterium]
MSLLSTGTNVLLIVLGFGLLIFVHELGHWWAATRAGIRCESFAIGLGPVIAAWRRGIGWRAGSTDPATIARFGKPAIEMTDDELSRHGLGETEWSLRLFPLGGFVRMLGQDDLDPSRTSGAARSYQRAAVGRRMVVVSAGVVANLVLAVVLFVIAFMAGVRFEAPVVGAVLPGSPAATATAADGGPAGLRTGDVVRTIDGEPVQTFADIQIAGAMAKPDQPLAVEVTRTVGGRAERRTFSVLPRRDPVTGLLQIGIGPALAGGIGAVRPDERAAFDEAMARAGLAPERMPDGRDDPLADLLVVQVGTPAAGSVHDRHLAQQWMDGEGDEPVGALSTAALDDAAAAGRGAPFRTSWQTASGRVVARTLVPVPRLQELSDPAQAASGAPPETGLLGMVPLLRIERLADGSPNDGILKPGDVILSVADVPGPRLGALRSAIAPYAGATVPARVIRGGTEVALDVKVDRAGRLGTVMLPAIDVPRIASTVERTGDAAAPVPTPAAGLGLLPGSIVREVGGTPVTDWASMRAAFLAATREAADRGEASPVDLVLEAPTAGRDRIEASMALSPADVRALHALGWASPVPAEVFSPLMTTLTAHGNPLRAVAMGFRQTKTLVIMTYLTLDRLARGTVGVDQLRGPVGIVHLGMRVADRGAMYLVFFLAMISVNLAVLNFLPLPIVDGGLFLYLVYEKLTGKAPSVAFQNAATTVGLVLLGTVFLLTFYNDVARLVGGG